MTTRRKIWTLKYVVGNPEIFTQVRQSQNLTKSKAMEGFKNLDNRWRKWVEMDGIPVLESDAQREFRRKEEDG